MEDPAPVELIGMDAAGTLAGLFRERVRLSPKGVAYREFDVPGRRWRDHTWQDIDRRVDRVRAALRRVGGFKPGDRLAIALPNGTDWVCFDLAALSLGLIVVPLYLHDSPANMAFILTNSGARGLVIDTEARWRSLLPHWPELIGLEHVWIRDGLGADSHDLARPGVGALPDVLEHQGQSEPWLKLKPDDIATIIYTSGTTGRPKGAMLSHRAILWNAAMTAQVVPPRSDDRFLSCLPLAHAFERTVGYYLPMLGGSQVIYARSIEALTDDLRAQRPTVFLGVPRLYERASIAVQARAQRNPIKRLLLRATARQGWARMEAQQSGQPEPGGLQRFVWRRLDRWVGTQVRLAFGGSLRVAVSGGAPLPLDVARFLIGLGIPLVEGYGLTEAGPVVTANKVGSYVPGTVGLPLEGIEIKVSSRGELLIRSPSVMNGYWNDEALTAEAIDAHGWLHTGDLAEIKEGRVAIRSRLKDLLVLSTGEKVAPGEIETAMLRDPLFEHALVVGDGKPFLAAVLVLDKTGWDKLATGLAAPAGALNHASARAEVLRRLGHQLAHFARHAQVRAVHLTLDRWTVENGLLTPTLKTKRAPIQAKYKNEIASIYADTAASRSE